MSYSDAEQRVQNDYMSSLNAGAVTPASSLIGSLNFIFLVGWLMACGSISDLTFQRSRFPVFVCIAYISVWNLLYTRSNGIVGSIGVGLNSVLCISIGVNFVLLYDPRAFSRLVLKRGDRVLSIQGHTSQKRDDEVLDDKETNVTWEPMPKSISRRMFWVLDLISGVRGVHWTWKPSPPPPHHISPDITTPGRRSHFFRNASRFAIDYLIIDLAKCLMIADPYFTHYPTRSAPLHIAPYISSPLGLYTYRVVLGAIGGFIAIDLEYTTAVLLQVNIIGPGVLGLNAFSTMFPPIWGSPRAILSKGLRGFWGETWHQVLRMHFVSIADAIADLVLRNRDSSIIDSQRTSNGKIVPLKPSRARVVIRIMMVFLLSGVLHAAASYTLLGHSRPWASFSFFAIQPLGIGIQCACSWLFVGPYLSDPANRWKELLWKGSNLCFTIVWMWTCSGLLLDDLTSGGMWMFEPIPLSLIRGLGFSKEDNRFWCW